MNENVPTPILRGMALRGHPAKKPGLSISTPNTPTAARKRAKEVESCINKLKDQLREEIAKNDDNESQIHHLKSEKDVLLKKISALNETIKNLRTDLYNYVEPNVHDQLRKEHDKLKCRLKDLEYSERSLKSTVTTYEEEMTELREQITSLGAELSKAKQNLQNVNDVTNERNILVEEIKEIVSKYEKSEELRKLEVSSLQNELEEMKVYYEQRLANTVVDDEEYSVLFDPNQDPISGNFNDVTGSGPASGKYESLGFVNELRCRELEEEIEQLTSSHDDEFKSLQASLAEYVSKNTSLEEENEQLKRKLNEIQEFVDEISRERITLVSDLDFATKELETEKYEHELTRGRLEQYNSDLSQFNDRTRELTSMKEKCELIEATLMSTQQELENAKEELMSTKTELISAQSGLRSSEVEMNEMKQRHESLEQELTTAKTELLSIKCELESYKIQLETSKNDLLAKNSEIGNLKRELESTQSQILELDSSKSTFLLSIDDLTEKITALNDQMTSLQNIVDLKELKIQNLASKCEDLSGSNMKLEEEKRSLSEQLTSINLLLANLKEEKSSLSQSLVDVRNQLESKCVELSNVMNDFEASQQEKVNLTHRLEEMKQSERSLKNQLSTLSLKVESLSVELDQKNNGLDDLLLKLQMAQNEISSKDAEMQELASEVEELSKKNSALMDKIQDRDGEIQQLREELTSSAEKFEPSEEIGLLKDQIAKKQKELLQSYSQITKLSAQCDDCRKSRNELSERFKSELENEKKMRSIYEAESKRLHIDLKVAKSELESLKEGIGSISPIDNEQKMQLESEIQRLNGDLLKFNNMLNQKDAQIEKLSRDLDESDQSYRMIKVTKDRLLKDIAVVEKQFKEHMEKCGKEVVEPHKITHNQTFLMPTTINITSGNERSAANLIHSLSESFVDSHTRPVMRQIDNGQFARRPPPGSGAVFTMADEDGEYMNNPSEITFLKRPKPKASTPDRSLTSSHNTTYIKKEENPQDRFAVVQARNMKSQPHLRSAYPSEYIDTSIDENMIRGTASRKVSAQVGDKTFTVTETTTRQVTASKNVRLDEAANVGRSLMNRLSPRAASLLRRGTRSTIWSPKYTKSNNEIPY